MDVFDYFFREAEIALSNQRLSMAYACVDVALCFIPKRALSAEQVASIQARAQPLIEAVESVWEGHA